jgi:hypothetical protein
MCATRYNSRASIVMPIAGDIGEQGSTPWQTSADAIVWSVDEI